MPPDSSALMEPRGKARKGPAPYTDEQRERAFWSNVEPCPATGCYLWTASLNASGYGQFRHGGKMKRANRLAWEYTQGPIPAGQWVLHHCDNRACVNPAHLYLGDNADNQRDAWSRGRRKYVRRRVIPQAKLTAEAVAQIRADKATPVAEMARRYGVAESTVVRVRGGRTWR